MRVKVNSHITLWMWFLANRALVGYLVFFAFAIYTMHATDVLAKQAAINTQIIANNQVAGTQFFLRECVANKQLLEYNATYAEAAAKSERESALAWDKKKFGDISSIWRLRAARNIKMAKHLRSLEPTLCSFDYNHVAGTDHVNVRQSPSH